jgi:hypothetical protein
MTKIPEEHKAARELYDAFVTLGRERAQLQDGSKRPRRRRSGRRLVLILTIAILAPAAAAGAYVLLGSPALVPDEPQLPPDVRRAPADRALAAARAADPAGGLPWAMRLYPSADGGRCALIGELKGGALGVFRQGRFHTFAPDAPGACAPSGQRRLIAAQGSGIAPNHRSVLFGFVDRSVTSIRIVDGGRETPVPIAPDGSYIVVTARTFTGTLVLKTDRGDVRRRLTR